MLCGVPLPGSPICNGSTSQASHCTSQQCHELLLFSTFYQSWVFCSHLHDVSCSTFLPLLYSTQVCYWLLQYPNALFPTLLPNMPYSPTSPQSLVDTFPACAVPPVGQTTTNTLQLPQSLRALSSKTPLFPIPRAKLRASGPLLGDLPKCAPG